MLLQVADVCVARNEPQQFINYGFQVQFLGGQQRETLTQVKTGLVAENTACPDPRPVGPVIAVFKDIIQQINILLHELLYIGRPKTLILTKFLQR